MKLTESMLRDIIKQELMEGMEDLGAMGSSTSTGGTYEEGYKKGREDERSEIVAWLMKQRGAGGSSLVPDIASDFAGSIKRRR